MQLRHGAQGGGRRHPSEHRRGGASEHGAVVSAAFASFGTGASADRAGGVNRRSRMDWPPLAEVSVDVCAPLTERRRPHRGEWPWPGACAPTVPGAPPRFASPRFAVRSSFSPWHGQCFAQSAAGARRPSGAPPSFEPSSSASSGNGERAPSSMAGRTGRARGTAASRAAISRARSIRRRSMDAGATAPHGRGSALASSHRGANCGRWPFRARRRRTSR